MEADLLSPLFFVLSFLLKSEKSLLYLFEEFTIPLPFALLLIIKNSLGSSLNN